MTMITEGPFKNLTAFQERRFVAPNADLASLDEIKTYYQKLIEQPIHSIQDLGAWLLNRSEFEAALDQRGSILYILMTCQTDNAVRAQNYRDFIEHIVPAIKPLDDELNRIYLKKADELNFITHKKEYALYTKGIKMDVSLFVKENIPLQTEVDLLSQEYQTLSGAMTVHFEGEEKTMPQMGKYLLEPDRNLRERAWKAVAERRLKDKDKLDELFSKMVKLRHRIALNAGCQNFCEFKFKSLHRFDYSPEDCKAYHVSVEETVVPLWAGIFEKRKSMMNLKALRPWDTAVDPTGKPPLKPFSEIEQLNDGCLHIFQKVDKDFGRFFSDMMERGLLDLASRKGKAPGGYQSTLNEARKPFIFMNSVGLDQDVRTLLHEGGHAFHAILCADNALLSYRHGPMEFNEVASMAMELLGGEYLSEFYNEEDFARSKEEHLEDLVFTLIWVATVDCFQHWIYEHPDHSTEERKKAWLNIRQRFGGNLTDWEGLNEEHASMWHRQLHIFEVPFYYIEYGIAQLGALQLWLNAKKNWSKAVADYKKGLSYGGSLPLPELFKAAGIKFDFSRDTIAPLMAEVKGELKV
jgi:oligoendopeptidase F